MGKIVNVSRKVPIAGRMEYSAQFKVNGQPYVRAFVRTQESPQTEDGHLDEEDMGVITAYCKTESESPRRVGRLHFLRKDEVCEFEEVPAGVA